MPLDVIAIDGPSAAGKSTVAKAVAQRLGLIYVDSGALYRAVTWKAIRDGIDLHDAGRIGDAMDSIVVRFFVRDGAVVCEIDGIEPGGELRSEAVRENVSAVAAIPRVRMRIVGWLRDMLRFGGLVMEGRDIGSAVFPDTRLKFYLDASPEQRAQRRQTELAAAGEEADVARVKKSLVRRDSMDSSRVVAPLTIPAGAIVIDTTTMGIQEVATRIAEYVTATSCAKDR